MKLLLSLLFTTCSLIGITVAQDKKQAGDLKSMVETERAFARMSEEKGTRESFAAFIADDGILFRPTAVLREKVDAGKSAAGVSDAASPRLATNLRVCFQCGRSRLYNRPLAIQEGHQRRSSGGLRKLHDGLEKAG